MLQIHTPRQRRASNRGVTLIELMIIVMIVGILASIAYPSYQNYLTRARRAEGKGMIMDVSARLERFYFDNNTYTTSMTALGYASATPNSESDFYTAKVEAGPSGDIATTYKITVTPTKDSIDKICGYLERDSRGVEDSEKNDNETCWR